MVYSTGSHVVVNSAGILLNLAIHGQLCSDGGGLFSRAHGGGDMGPSKNRGFHACHSRVFEAGIQSDGFSRTGSPTGILGDDSHNWIFRGTHIKDAEYRLCYSNKGLICNFDKRAFRGRISANHRWEQYFMENEHGFRKVGSPNSVDGGSGGGSASVQFRRAQRADVPGILKIVHQQKTLKQSVRDGLPLSEAGFLIAHLSASEIIDSIEKEPAVFVALVDNAVAGFILATNPESNLYEDLEGPDVVWHDDTIRNIYNAKDYLYLWMIGVDSDHQKKKLGSQLIELLVKRARELGRSAIILDVMLEPVENKASCKFFERNQFDDGGVLRLDDYYGVGESSWRIFWKKV
jgi:ribosomal protein S18 acetylase RimI-like enzyme